MFFTKEKKQQVNKYIVMAKYKSHSSFYVDKQFDKLSSADKYVELMKDNKDNSNLEYFLFEQSKDYNYAETIESI